MRRRDILQFHCWRDDSRALLRTDLGKDLSHRYSHGRTTNPTTTGTGKMLVDGLAKRGFNVGQNLIYEARGAAGNVSQTPNLMQELKAANRLTASAFSFPFGGRSVQRGFQTRPDLKSTLCVTF